MTNNVKTSKFGKLYHIVYIMLSLYKPETNLFRVDNLDYHQNVLFTLNFLDTKPRIKIETLILSSVPDQCKVVVKLIQAQVSE